MGKDELTSQEAVGRLPEYLMDEVDEALRIVLDV